jgi:hypothetical protein
VKFAGKRLRVFERERLAQLPQPDTSGLKSDSTRAKMRPWREGCFAQDAVGDWYLCLPVLVEVQQQPAKKLEAGLDLGLKTLATASDRWKVEPPGF